jgi:hypothetical protein
VPSPASLSTYQRYESVTIHRSLLKNAPYNPRTLSDKARAKIRENIKRVGLLQGPIWNERTGNIVGGHQRLAVLDALEGKADYLITVEKVSLDERTEKEQNVFLNNEEAQGEFDMDLLNALGSEDGINFENMGFEVSDWYNMFGTAAVSQKSSEEMEKLAEQYRELVERHDSFSAAVLARDDENFYLVVVFKDDAARLEFLEALELPDNRFVDGRMLQAWLGVKSSGRKRKEEPGQDTGQAAPGEGRGNGVSAGKKGKEKPDKA